MHRRQFLKFGAALSVAGSLPVWSHKVWAAQRPVLPVPPLLPADKQGKIRLRLQQGTMSWKPGMPTPTWGINGGFLGPALLLERGQKVRIDVENHLPETTTMHWHGLAIPGMADGGPHAPILSQASWTADFRVEQPAATAWFHPHTHGSTGHQVAMGLAGLIVIKDEETRRIGLPERWGWDDVPLVLQDKRLDSRGQVDYQLDTMTAAVGWFGDRMLTNGAVYPQHSAPKGWLRLRLLNGCNARTLRLAISDGRPFYVIGSDGGLLSEPVKVNVLPVWMGERFEVMVDASDGKSFDVVSLPVNQMGMALPPFDSALPVLKVVPSGQPGSGRLPDRLAQIPALPAIEGLRERRIVLSMDPALDKAGMQALMDKYGDQAMSGMSMDGHGMTMSRDMPVGGMPHMAPKEAKRNESHSSMSAKEVSAKEMSAKEMSAKESGHGSMMMNHDQEKPAE